MPCLRGKSCRSRAAIASACTCPMGPPGYPDFMRLAERPENVIFLARTLRSQPPRPAPASSRTLHVRHLLVAVVTIFKRRILRQLELSLLPPPLPDSSAARSSGVNGGDELRCRLSHRLLPGTSLHLPSTVC